MTAFTRIYNSESREAYIPNKEIQEVFYKAVRQSQNDRLVQFMRQSETITIAMLSAFGYYHRPIREFPAGKGFADIVYLPLPQYPNYPAVVVELKWNKSVKAAVSQIKERRYPEALAGYAGEILLVGIAYDKRTKEHVCEIESIRGRAV